MVYNQFYEGINEWFLINKIKQKKNFFQSKHEWCKEKCRIMQGFLIIIEN